LRQECARLQARNRELLSDGSDSPIACEQKCATLQAQNDKLLKEAAIPRGGASDTSASANAEDHAPSPSRLSRLPAVLQSSDAAVRACLAELAELGPAVDFEQALDEELDEMRQIPAGSHAARFWRWRASRS
jgi:hypothetical protein